MGGNSRLGKGFAGPPRTTTISYGWLHRWRDVIKYPCPSRCPAGQEHVGGTRGKEGGLGRGSVLGALEIPEGAAIWRLLFVKK